MTCRDDLAIPRDLVGGIGEDLIPTPPARDPIAAPVSGLKRIAA